MEDLQRASPRVSCCLRLQEAQGEVFTAGGCGHAAAFQLRSFLLLNVCSSPAECPLNVLSAATCEPWGLPPRSFWGEALQVLSPYVGSSASPWGPISTARLCLLLSHVSYGSKVLGLFQDVWAKGSSYCLSLEYVVLYSLCSQCVSYQWLQWDLALGQDFHLATQWKYEMLFSPLSYHYKSFMLAFLRECACILRVLV